MVRGAGQARRWPCWLLGAASGLLLGLAGASLAHALTPVLPRPLPAEPAVRIVGVLLELDADGFILVVCLGNRYGGTTANDGTVRAVARQPLALAERLLWDHTAPIRRSDFQIVRQGRARFDRAQAIVYPLRVPRRVLLAPFNEDAPIRLAVTFTRADGVTLQWEGEVWLWRY